MSTWCKGCEVSITEPHLENCPELAIMRQTRPRPPTPPPEPKVKRGWLTDDELQEFNLLAYCETPEVVVDKRTLQLIVHELLTRRKDDRK